VARRLRRLRRLRLLTTGQNKRQRPAKTIVAAHALDASRNHDVLGARDDRLRCEMEGLLG
jgi:hypothetical protein